LILRTLIRCTSFFYWFAEHKKLRLVWRFGTNYWLPVKADTFNDPQEALSNFKPGYYDLVILDFKMPKMDGFELYEKIKERDDKAKICFLTVSESYYEEFRKKEYSALDKNLFLK
jgi:CheY-like chemotaxis protein